MGRRIAAGAARGNTGAGAAWAQGGMRHCATPVFILYAIPLGILAGYLLGGRLDRLGDIRFHWGWLAVAGLIVQVGLFSSGLGDILGPASGAVVYVLSTAAVLVAVLRNLAMPGMALVALGAASNLAAIVANGGVMPTTAAALRAAGMDPDDGFSNSAVLADPALSLLTDIFALPAWLPFANVFSIGDVLLGLGVAVVIAMGMRQGATLRS